MIFEPMKKEDFLKDNLKHTPNKVNQFKLLFKKRSFAFYKIIKYKQFDSLTVSFK